MLPTRSLLDPATTAVFMEKPLAPHYADGRAIVAALEEGGFRHGVVHQFLTTPGVSMALELIPQIRPLSAQMLFGYEVGPGLEGNAEYSGQRPDFNWTLAAAGGGIILDMIHEGYLSEALFGETESLSAVACLLVPKRLSTDGHTVIDYVEDYAALRRQHTSGVVNTSVWSWYRRVNSEFGPWRSPWTARWAASCSGCTGSGAVARDGARQPLGALGLRRQDGLARPGRTSTSSTATRSPSSSAITSSPC